MDIKWSVVTDAQEFLQLTKDWKGPIACDVETAKNVHLLGVAISDGSRSLYLPITMFSNQVFVSTVSADLTRELKQLLLRLKLVGHNFTYDKRFIDAYFGIDSSWIADTRIMWHLASAPSGPRPYGLKDAQTEVLGWTETNAGPLKAEVEAAGGKLSNGDHYLASPLTLAKYACLDVCSTYSLYSKLAVFFNDNDYWPMLAQMMHYNLLLEANTSLGLRVDKEGLQKAHNRLVLKKEAAKKRFLRLVKQEVEELEEDWKDRKISSYKREYNRIYYQNHPERWEKFNFNSDPHKRELFFDKLGLTVTERTASGLPSTSAEALRSSIYILRGSSADPTTIRSRIQQGPLSDKERLIQAVEAYLKYEKANTISSNFSGPYLSSIEATGRLHPGFNICGTVSYRLSGFKPYLLNAPFDEKDILQHVRVEDGYIGVHADLSAIEPTITAHYSEDESLHKVFGKGLGDIYLDLALTLFPTDVELKKGYNPHIPITKAVKEKFAKQRKIAKVIQLAVQYTGTGLTVSRNLTKEGIPTTRWEAEGYVRAYWEKFRKVHEMNQRLFALNREEGHLRNVIGRIIQVPDPSYKDLPNRFVQSSAHDVLVLWVIKIYRLCKEQGITIKPVLVDCHDSTSNQCPAEQADSLKNIYLEALQEVNRELGLSVTVRADMKTFTSLAGLKGEE